MKKTAILIGGRPQIIKAFPIIREANAQHKNILTIDSGQHFSKNLSSAIYESLNIRKPGLLLRPPHKQSAFQISYLIKELYKIFSEQDVNTVIVFGDMTTTLAGAIAANKAKKILVHVEAGIRSRNRGMEEEINRILVDHLSNVLITPNANATENLNKENIVSSNQISNITQSIMQLGDIMKDSLAAIKKDLPKRSIDGEYILLTLHRAENVDDRSRICEIFDFISKNFAQNQVVFLMHPRTKKRFAQFGFHLPKNIVKLEAQTYPETISLMHYSKMVLTDSGGMQKEACWLGKPCIILREDTEWPDLIKSKRAVLYKNYKKNFIFRPVSEISSEIVSKEIIKIMTRIEDI